MTIGPSPPRARPHTLPMRVGVHVAEPIRSHQDRTNAARSPSAPVGAGTSRDLDRPLHHGLGDVAHDAIATPSATSVSTSSRP